MSVQKGAIGVIIELTITEDDVAVNLSSATTKNIVLRSPSGVVATKTGAFVTDGSDGKLKYTTTAEADLNEAGFWKAQAALVMTGFTGRSSSAQFEVMSNL
jgi:hypothetical protein